jgi:hypothetical protein
VTLPLVSKGIRYGQIRAHANGAVDASGVQGVNPDLRVRPFFAQGGTISIREFAVGAFNAEMGLEASDPLLHAAAAGQRVVTPAGMVLDGALDEIEAPPALNEADDSDGDGVRDELPAALVDHMEFYLLNYFKPGLHQQTPLVQAGRRVFDAIRCASCHVADLSIERDRRVADVETVFDPARGHFNRLFATATLKLVEVDDGLGYPTLKQPALQPFVVRNFFADLKRHDLGPAFHERNHDGSVTTEFMTEPLWGVGSTAPYGHDGRSINLREVILRHGGEAKPQRDAFAALPEASRVARVPRVARALPAGRHGVEPRSGRPGGSRLPPARPRLDQARCVVQRSERSRVSARRAREAGVRGGFARVDNRLRGSREPIRGAVSRDAGRRSRRARSALRGAVRRASSARASRASCRARSANERDDARARGVRGHGRS